MIGKTAQLTFHEVLDQVAAKPAKPAAGELYLPSENGQGFLRLAKPAMTGELVSGAEGRLDPQQVAQGWFVEMNFKGDGGKIWANITGKAACQPVNTPQRLIAIVLDNEIISAPQVDPNGGNQLCNVGIGRRHHDDLRHASPRTEAKDLAALISGGALPVPVEVIDQRTVGPSLGQDAIQASALAAIIGARADRAVHRHRLPPGRPDGGPRPDRVRRDVVRRPDRARSHAHPARPGRLRAGDRDGGRRERARLRARPRGLHLAAGPTACADRCAAASRTRCPRSPTRTSPPCSPPVCCSSWPPGRSAASASR